MLAENRSDYTRPGQVPKIGGGKSMEILGFWCARAGFPSGDYVEMILDNQNVPEPASAIVFLGLLGGICARRRRSGT